MLRIEELTIIGLLLLVMVYCDSGETDIPSFTIQMRRIPDWNNLFDAYSEPELERSKAFESDVNGARNISWKKYNTKLNALPDVYKKRWYSGIFIKVSKLIL